MFQGIEQQGPHGLFGSRIAQRFQRFQANRRILILAGCIQQRLTNIGVSRVRLQRLQAIEPHTGIKAIATLNYVGDHAADIGIVQAAGDFDGLFRVQFHAHVLCCAADGGREINPGYPYLGKLVIRKVRAWMHIDRFIERVHGIARKIPLGSLHAEEKSNHHQHGAAPRGAQRHPAAKRTEDRGFFQDRRPHQIVESFRKFAAALRKQHASRIQTVGILGEGTNEGLQILFFGKLRAARSTNSQMLLDQR